MSSLPTIRRGSLSDLPIVLAMLRDLAAQHVAYDSSRFVAGPDLDTAYADWISRTGPAGRVLCVIAESPPESPATLPAPLAYLIAELFPADPAYFTGPHVYVHDLYLTPEARGTGLAKQLLAAGQDWARSHGVHQLRALIATANTRSLAFFHRQGFRDTATEVTLDLAVASPPLLQSPRTVQNKD